MELVFGLAKHRLLTKMAMKFQIFLNVSEIGFGF